jgi:hypothetical protein
MQPVNGDVRHRIPRVVDADEEEKERHRADSEEGSGGLARDRRRGDQQCGVRDEREHRVPEPVLEDQDLGELPPLCLTLEWHLLSYPPDGGAFSGEPRTAPVPPTVRASSCTRVVIPTSTPGT